MSAAAKRQMLFLTTHAERDPWSRAGRLRTTEAALAWNIERVELTATPDTWVAPADRAGTGDANPTTGEASASVEAIWIDLDSIRKTRGLDTWVIQAWKATINGWVVKTMSAGSPPPEVVGFCREPSWEIAQLGAQLGVRDLVSGADLGLRFGESVSTISPPTSTAPSPIRFSELKGRFHAFDSVSDAEDSGAQAAEASDSNPPDTEIPRHVIPFPIDGLDGHSPGIEAVRKLIRRTAPLDTPVIIRGATGSGKELVAKTLHRYSPRADGPFIAVNCGAISAQLVESELFGHVRGSFTGATNDKIGLLSAAGGGTLFLDELTELSSEIQVKLLRALQEKTIFPVGSTDAQPIDIRIISATKDDIEEHVRDGKFREDLYYRLKVIEIALPSLAERKSDLPDIIKSILKRTARKHRRPALDLESQVLEKFVLYDWPGNIRELENVLERASTLCWAENRTRLTLADIPEEVKFSTMRTGNAAHLKEVVRRFEREFIASTVRRLGGSKELAADSLGLSLATLYRKLGS